MRRSDLISGSLLVVFGLVMIFIIVPYQISASSEYGLDPKFFPETLLWLLVIMGVLLVVTRLFEPPDPEDTPPVLDGKNWLVIGSFSVFFFVVFVAINKIGFVLGGAMMIALLMFVLTLRHRNWTELIAVSIIAPAVIYYTLYHLFSVQLPSLPFIP